jgi:hypothetical protein
MWANVSDEEKQRCQDLRDSRAQHLPAVNATTVPNDAKQKGDSPPARAIVAAEEDAEGEAGVADAAASERVLVPGDENGAGPPRKKTRINTTTLPFWPDRATLENVVIPEINESDEEDGLADEDSKEERATQRRDRARQKCLEAEFLFPGKDEK